MLIKPDAIAKKKIGAIITIIENRGFEILELRMFQMSNDTAERLYKIHKGEHYYERLIRFMTEGKTVAAVLKKENAITELRRIIGSTDPKDAEKGTIRQLYGNSVPDNAVHASDSPESANRENSIIFPARTDPICD